MPAAKNPTKALTELALTFVEKQKGDWNHEEWEQLVTRASSAGFAMDDEAKRNLGNILEALKFFYHIAPKAAPAKTAAKKKTSARK